MMRTAAGMFFEPHRPACKREASDAGFSMITLTRAGMFPSKTETLAGKARARFHSATLFIRLHYSMIKNLCGIKSPARRCGARRFGQIMKPGGISA
jgi:hypothetical protein